MKTETDPLFGRVNITEITHQEFLEGMRDRTIILKIPNKRGLMKREQVIRFTAIASCYLLGPVILGLIFAIVWRSFMPLLAIPVAWFMCFVTTWLSRMLRTTVSGLLFIVGVVQAFRLGLHNPASFLTLAAFWGIYWFRMADISEEQSALHNLIELPEIFQEALERKMIYMEYIPKSNPLS